MPPDAAQIRAIAAAAGRRMAQSEGCIISGFPFDDLKLFPKTVKWVSCEIKLLAWPPAQERL